VRLRSRDLFQTAHTEGGLLPADLLQRVADGDRTLPSLAPADYHLTPGERLNEAITRSWTRLTGAWRAFDEARDALPAGDPAGRLTRERWLQPLFEELRYGRLVQQPAIEIEAKSFPVFSQWQHTPIHLVGCGVRLDARTPGVKGAAGQSPHSLVQELLNRSPTRLWGIVSNGLALRVLRDSVALTRQAYLEFDLEAMFTGEVYADFVLLWLVCHQSRVEADKPESCPLEQWTYAAAQDGTRALDTLRHGVEDAIQTLGAGFLAQPANHELHAALRDGTLDGADYYRQLLRLVYRLLFLFVAEDRDALLDPKGDPLARERYLAHYSTRRLRDLAIKRRGGRQHDRYEQLKLVMAALDTDGCAPLALPALGSYLWSRDATGLLADCTLANDDLLAAIRSLSTIDEGVRRAVDFRNLGSEELGSVYESLLELHPTLDRATATFTLDEVAGSERKTTGSYYTPTSLISSLLDSALEPVLDEAARADDPEATILSLSVVDPACGSGHFLIAAANRIAKRLAAVRSHDPEPSPGEVRAALRDVVGSCIHGVDLNPMAVELCKVSLWMEALEPGRPLSFLDHRIVLGNALLGTTPELLAAGIPADAFKPILGDDKKIVTELRKRNAKELSGQLALDLASSTADADVRAIAAAATEISVVDDSSLAGVREQQRRFEQLLGSPELRRARLAADIWCAAFVAEKRPGAQAITQDTLVRALGAGSTSLSEAELQVVAAARANYAFLHWHVAFAAVAERGGFDVVLGNPPWERVKLQEKEFFAARSPEIATAPNKAARDRLIRALAEDAEGGGRELLTAFLSAKRGAEGASHFIRQSGCYPLCGRGDINTYAVFAERFLSIRDPTGSSGIVVKTGLVGDATYSAFLEHCLDSDELRQVLDFDNRGGLFPAVLGNVRFCLVTLRRGRGAPFVAARLMDPLDAKLAGRGYRIDTNDLHKLYPQGACIPLVSSARDAHLLTKIHNEASGIREADWNASLGTMVHMASGSSAFRNQEQLNQLGTCWNGTSGTVDGEAWLPLYESKFIGQFDHRAATFDGVAAEARFGVHAGARRPSATERDDPMFAVTPRYWVPDGVIAGTAMERQRWILGFRDAISATADARSAIGAIVPNSACGHTLSVITTPDATTSALLLAVLNSFVFDYLVKQKVSGGHLVFGAFEQMPLPTRRRLDDERWATEGSLLEWIASRVVELTFTAFDLAPFAVELGYEGQPFGWDPDRRALIRAELDGAMFRLYGIERDDVDYILDTFPIVRRRDEERFGEYRTKRVILESFDAMVAADAAGVEYVTSLDPPPGVQRHEVRA
jgi:methylase of polypeptide subunit release factors